MLKRFVNFKNQSNVPHSEKIAYIMHHNTCDAILYSNNNTGQQNFTF